MKKLNLFFVCILSGLLSYSQDTITLKSEINDVVVFKEGAQIKRSASLSIKKGRTTVNLNELTSNMDVSTVKVSADNNVTVVSVSHRFNFLNKDKSNNKIKELDAQLESLVDSTDLYKKFLIVLNDEKLLLYENKKIGGSQNGVDIENLKATSEFYRKRMMEIELQILSYNNKIKRFNKDIIKISRQLNELNIKRDFTTSDLVVVLASETGKKVNLKFEYFLTDAGWKPYYDIRVTDVNDPVKIIYKAKIYQNSDIDWENVKLTLSTGNPSVSGVKPILDPYVLSQYNSSYNKYLNSNKTYSGLVRGIITDDAGMPLPGVSILVKGTTVGTMTMADGSYSINVPEGTNSIVLSYIGLESQEIAISGDKVDAVLMPSSQNIEEVVVVAYGIAKDNTKDYPGDILQGKISGLKIRGNSNVNGGNKPLYVIDGVPVSNWNNNKYSYGNIGNDINPDNFESVNVLKGGEATSIYGSRAANGVVVIKTKKSKPIKQKNIIPHNLKKNQTSKEFIIDIPYTIRSDNKEYDVTMTEFYINADYRHHSVPKLSEKVFLTALITDYEDFGMLNGEANIFFKETYTGKTFLDLTTMTDTMNLSLGVDNEVIIEREQIKEYTQSKYLGTTRKDSRAWKISIKNMKDYPVNLMIEDQLPMTNNNKVKVDKIEISGAKEDTENGKLKWMFKLDPQKNKEILLKYAVKYPTYMNLVVE